MKYNNMNGKGIEITYVDGTTEHFDPITDWNETEENFSFYIGGHTYKFNIDDVVNIREYDLCEDCGHEIYYDGCRRCYMEKELTELKMEQQLIIGCNYHTTWQSHSAMRFVLVEIKGDKARLKTRASKKDFWTDVKDLIFIDTNYNRNKGKRLSDDRTNG